MNKECVYCRDKRRPTLNDTANSEFAISVEKDEESYYIANEYDWGNGIDYCYYNINYCPVCGRKLGAAEVLEVHGQSGQVYYQEKTGDSLC